MSVMHGTIVIRAVKPTRKPINEVGTYLHTHKHDW